MPPSSCQSTAMPINDPETPQSAAPPERRGGGCFIAAGVIVGPVVGVAIGQTTAGLVAGLAFGILAAIGLFIADYRRR